MARTRVARFNIMITASADQVRQVFTKLSNDSRTWATSFTAGLTSVSFAWNQVLGAVGPVAAKIGEVSNRMVELGQQSRRLGVSAEFFQVVEMALGRVGVATDNVIDILDDFQERVGLLRRGDKGLTETFQALGLSAQTLSRDMATAFLQVTDALREVEDQAIQTSLAEELFADAGKKMIEAVRNPDAIDNAARALDRMGGAITEQEIKLMEDFNREWTELNKRFEVTFQRLVVSVTPALIKFVNVIEQAVDGVQFLNRVSEESALMRFALRGAFPGASLFGTGEEGVSASNAVRAARGQESREQQKQTRLLESIDSKTMPNHFAFTVGGIS